MGEELVGIIFTTDPTFEVYAFIFHFLVLLAGDRYSCSGFIWDKHFALCSRSNFAILLK